VAPPARASLVCAVLAYATLAAAGCWPADDESEQGADAEGSRPNVVVVLTDDQDVASLAVMPEVARLIAAEGVEFTNAYATTPECCPSRASLLTGQYTHNHGVLSAKPPQGGYGAFDGSRALPLWMQDAGYRTAFVGKYLNGYGSPGQGNDPAEVPEGWDDWTALTNGTEHEMYDYELNRDGVLASYGERPRDYLTDVLSERAAALVREAAPAERPFMLIAAPLAPHGEGSLEGTGAARDPRPAPRHLGAFDGPLPLEPAADRVDPSQLPAALRSRAAKTAAKLAGGEGEAIARGRLESLLAVDEMVADLVGELERAGELAETVVVFTSDNGFLIGEHGLLGKELPYEPAARVPLLVRGPGFPAGETSDALVANIDIAPTLAELGGAEPKLEVDGSSLLDAAGGGGDPERAIVLEYLTGPRAYRAIRTGDSLYARFAEGGELLFDLASDPAENHNLARDPERAELRAELAERLAELARCAGTSCR